MHGRAIKQKSMNHGPKGAEINMRPGGVEAINQGRVVSQHTYRHAQYVRSISKHEERIPLGGGRRAAQARNHTEKPRNLGSGDTPPGVLEPHEVPHSRCLQCAPIRGHKKGMAHSLRLRQAEQQILTDLRQVPR